MLRQNPRILYYKRQKLKGVKRECPCYPASREMDDVLSCRICAHNVPWMHLFVFSACLPAACQRVTERRKTDRSVLFSAIRMGGTVLAVAIDQSITCTSSPPAGCFCHYAMMTIVTVPQFSALVLILYVIPMPIHIRYCICKYTIFVLKRGGKRYRFRTLLNNNH